MSANRTARSNGIIVPAVEHMPILGQTKLFHAWNETTVCTVECKGPRGVIAIGFSNAGRTDGVATYFSIEEACAFVALIEIAIADAERIERGETPFAREGVPGMN